MSDFKSKIYRAISLYKLRGMKWFVISVMGELPLFSSLFGKLANMIQSTKAPIFFSGLGGIHSNQLWFERRAALGRKAAEILKGPAKVLEIGTWFGKGSTQVWLSTLHPGSSMMLIDSWRAYFSKAVASGAARRMDSMHHVAINSTLNEVYKFESQRELEIQVVRAESKSFLPLLKDDLFDVIYIDGSHYYEDVKKDIQNAKRLIRKGGLICGYDFDLLPTNELIELARKSLELDLLVLPDGTAIHPGVMLAVVEEFKDVRSENGFWWIDPAPVSKDEAISKLKDSWSGKPE